MNALTAGAFGVAGALAELPVTAVAYSVPAHGSIRVPQRWWRGASAPPMAVIAAALLAGVVAGVLAVRLPLSPALPAFWLFAVVGVGLAVTDVRRRRLPHAMTGTLWATCGLGLAGETVASGHVHSLVTGATAGASVVVLALLIAFALPGQLGLGDVSLAGVIALSLGGLSLSTAVLGLVTGIALQACIAVAGELQSRNRLSRSHLPFGPALLMGWFVALVASAR